jgi:hypothetical protein
MFSVYADMQKSGKYWEINPLTILKYMFSTSSLFCIWLWVAQAYNSIYLGGKKGWRNGSSGRVPA